MNKKPTTGANDLLKIADNLRRQATKAENQIRWREKTFALLYSEDRDRSLSLLQVAQVQRDGGAMTEDEALHIIFFSVEQLASDAIVADPTLNEIRDKIDAIRKCEGVSDEDWSPNDPNAPEDYRILSQQWDRRADEIIASILRQHGEDEIADLYLNNKSTFDHRLKAGHLSLTGHRQQNARP